MRTPRLELPCANALIRRGATVAGHEEADEGEVCIDGASWLPVDTAFGQWPADATHLKLVQGELGDQAVLLRAMGHITIDLLASRTAS